MYVFKKWNMHLNTVSILNIHIPTGAILKPRLLVIQKNIVFNRCNIQNKSGTQLDIMLTLHQIIFSILYLSITTVNILVQDHIHAP